MANSDKIILSVFEEGILWAQPYINAGYTVLKEREFVKIKPSDIDVHGMLLVPPYESFTIAGSPWWPRRDKLGITKEAVLRAQEGLDYITKFNPKWWALANPTGRIKPLLKLGEPQLKCNASEYGDKWRRRIEVWGNFIHPIKNVVVVPKLKPDVKYLLIKSGQLIGKPKKLIPPGFAQAFMESNP
jgi:hypothetical protein